MEKGCKQRYSLRTFSVAPYHCLPHNKPFQWRDLKSLENPKMAQFAIWKLKMQNNRLRTIFETILKKTTHKNGCIKTILSYFYNLNFRKNRNTSSRNIIQELIVIERNCIKNKWLSWMNTRTSYGMNHTVKYDDLC